MTKWHWHTTVSYNRRCSNYIWVINNLITYKSASYIRVLTVYDFLTHCGQNKMAAILQQQFQMHILQWKWKWLGATRQQDITWTNVYPDLCHYMPSLDHNVLKRWGILQTMMVMGEDTIICHINACLTRAWCPYCQYVLVYGITDEDAIFPIWHIHNFVVLCIVVVT